jgi:hypothetical protein
VHATHHTTVATKLIALSPQEGGREAAGATYARAHDASHPSPVGSFQLGDLRSTYGGIVRDEMRVNDPNPPFQVPVDVNNIKTHFRRSNLCDNDEHNAGVICDNWHTPV